MAQPGFVVHQLRFRGEVMAPLRLPPAMGAALRGALFGTLRQQFCVAGRGPGCGTAAVAGGCPVCFLLAPIDEQATRGRDVPRPYVIQPPLRGPLAYEPGQILEFGLATFGRALGHFPYTLLGVEEMGRQGLGAGRGGAFRLDEVWAEHSLLGRQEAVFLRARDAVVRTPNLPVEAAQVAEEVARLADLGAGRRLRLELQSHTRLIEGGKLVKPEMFTLRGFMGRLLERLTALFGRYGGAAVPFDAPALLRQAEQVPVVARQLGWQELFRASGRHGRMLPMGGLVGWAELEGYLAPFLPWLVWGTLTHVGKEADVGNGRYRITIPPLATPSSRARGEGGLQTPLPRGEAGLQTPSPRGDDGLQTPSPRGDDGLQTPSPRGEDGLQTPSPRARGEGGGEGRFPHQQPERRE